MQCIGEYTHRRFDGQGAPILSCTAMLPGPTSNGISLSDINTAFYAAEKAFAAKVPLYGSDGRPCDGAVFQVVDSAGRSVLVGGDCATGGCSGPNPSCVPVPPELTKLAAMLHAVDEQELATPACSAFH